MNIRTLKDYDDLLKIVALETGNKDIDRFCNSLAQLILHLKEGHLAVINELFTMYDSASEHNVDVGRRAIFDLAQRLAGPDSVHSKE